MSRSNLILVAWAFLVLGLLVRAFANALVGPNEPPKVSFTPHRVDVNKAGVPELTVLPGIGRLRAEAIVVERIRNGPFRVLGDLERVDGLGPNTLHALRSMVTFGACSVEPAPR